MGAPPQKPSNQQAVSGEEEIVSLLRSVLEELAMAVLAGAAAGFLSGMEDNRNVLLDRLRAKCADNDLLQRVVARMAKAEQGSTYIVG